MEQGMKNAGLRAILSRKIVQVFLTLLTLLFLFLGLFFSSTADAAQSRDRTDASTPLKVGFYPDNNYMSVSNDGTYAGFNIDYLEEIANYTGSSYLYIDFDTPVEAYQALQAGEIDVLPSEHYTSDRANDVLFSKRAQADAYVTLVVRQNEDRYAYEDFPGYTNMVVGCVEGSRDTELFMQYCEENYFKPEIRFYENVGQLLNALNDESLDAAALYYLGNNSPYRVIAQFYPEPLYFAFAATQSETKTAFDQAMDLLMLRDPTYAANLYKRYFSVNATSEPVFTRQQQYYIENAQTFRVVYEANRHPLSYTDNSTGEFKGAIASLFDDISESTGLRFEYVEAPNHLAAIEMIEQGNADIICSTTKESVSSADANISITGSYLISYLSQVSSRNFNGSRIAIPAGQVLPSTLADEYANAEITYYDTPRECVEAVAGGKADNVFLDTHVSDYLLSQSEFSTLDTITLTNQSRPLSIGVSPARAPFLLDILDRAVMFTTDNEMSQWIGWSTAELRHTSLLDFAQQYPLQILVAVFMLAVIIVSVIYYIYYSRLRNREKIEELSYGDSLTKGWNLTRYQGEVEQILRAQPSQDYAILYFDISRFKSFNAAFGFAQGDRLLIAINDLLGSYTENDECFARITADEFVVLSEWDGWDRFSERFDRFDDALNKMDVLTEKEYRVLLAGGVSMIDRTQNQITPAKISEYIDNARYARETIIDVTRSTAVLYSVTMKEKDIAKRELANEAEAALRDGEFVAYYQPKVEIKTNRIVSFEALARWESNTKGLRSPGEFIPLFESNGFVKTLDIYIFRLVCERIKHQLAAGRPVMPIACNFSRLHLEASDFPEQIKAIVDEYEIPPHFLGLELTESIVMDNYERAKTMCVRLKKLGFSVLIDDFGTGYSSLGTLQDLPVDVLKLDRSFLRDSEEVERTKAILEGTIQIAEKIGVEVVVEGVETQAQADMLVALDDKIVAQGFLYSRPVPLAESEKQLDNIYLEPHEET